MYTIVADWVLKAAARRDPRVRYWLDDIRHNLGHSGGGDWWMGRMSFDAFVEADRLRPPEMCRAEAFEQERKRRQSLREMVLEFRKNLVTNWATWQEKRGAR
jgi:hypothetical protein